MVSLQQARQLLIERLHAYCEEQATEPEIYEDVIFDLVASEIGLPKTRLLIDELSTEGVLRQVTLEPIKFTVTRQFYEQYEAYQSEKKPTEPTEQQRSAPASDRVVPLNHNSDPYKEAVASLDRAITAFRDDHHLDNKMGPEKSVLLKTLAAGRELLADTTVRVATVITTIVNPLKIVSEEYRGAIAAGLITAAADNVFPLLEKAIKAILSLMGLS